MAEDIGVRKVLIAGRGEIAVRIARACRDEGLASVAVFADPVDRAGVHVLAADLAVPLAGHTPAQTYLNPAAVLRAALACGADVLHPGYGPLAESDGFAAAVLDAGLTWIGPPPAVIRRLSDKLSARLMAAQAGAPLLPGTSAPVPGPAAARAFARQAGLPVAIKATRGGGGAGVAVAWSEEDIPAAYAHAMRAAAAHGDGQPACFAERHLEHARHLETQCLADSDGNVAVISTRDCSVQRRHQKIAEEAPAPFLPDGTEAQLRATSKALLRAAAYVGAATCEFLLGPDGTLAFLEINPRLAMAHPVSEEVAGLDLVRETFRLAAGEPLGYGDRPARGHAIQFRVYAEDPGRGFAPVPGTLRDWRLPSGPGVRIDPAAGPGSVIVPVFGTLLAKLTVTGISRQQALERARRALGEFEVSGIVTNLPFYRKLVLDEEFAPPEPGRPFAVHTGWADARWGSSVPAPATPCTPSAR